jgi:hypothetical protein
VKLLFLKTDVTHSASKMKIERFIFGVAHSERVGVLRYALLTVVQSVAKNFNAMPIFRTAKSK